MGLRVSALRFDYDQRPLLAGVDIDVRRGESAFLLGPSGAGKTTVLRCIAGLERGYSGTITWDGASIDALPPHRRGAGFLFQEPALFPHLDVWRNVAFGLRYRDVPRSKRHDEAVRWLRLVGLAERAGDEVDELSGGQRQRVALARTLAAEPRIVLLDEPFSALDRRLRDELGARVKALLARQGVAALWVTHDEDEAFRLGDRVWRLHSGHVRSARPALARRPDSPSGTSASAGAGPSREQGAGPSGQPPNTP